MIEPHIIATNIYPEFAAVTADERCGLIYRRGQKVGVVEVPNRHEEPEDFFRILASDAKKHLPKGTRLIGVLHTHPNRNGQEPSMPDIEYLPDDLLGLVIHPRSKSWTLYDNKVGVLAFHDGSKK